MSSDKKILSILGFLGILVGLLCLNIFFLKISKSIVEMNKGAVSIITPEPLTDKNQEISSTNEKQIQENNKIIESSSSKNAKEIISNLAVFLDKNNNEKLNNNINNNNEKIDNAELVKLAAAIEPIKFLEIEKPQEANFKESKNHTIKELYPDFPEVDLDPPAKSKHNPEPIPIIEGKISEAEVKAADNKTNNLNSTTQIIIVENRNATATVSENKTTCVDVLQENKNSTTIRISENRTIVIDLPKKEDKQKNTTAAAAKEDKKSDNVTSTSAIIPDAIVVVHKNQTDKAIISDNTKNNNNNNSALANEQVHNQNITIVNETYKANVTIVPDYNDSSCDFEDEEEKEEKAEHINKDHYNNDHHNKKHKKASSKHQNRNDKHHGKRCRNKKHAHYVELAAAGESSNLIQESKNEYIAYNQIKI